MSVDPLFNLTGVGDFLILANPDPYIGVSNILGWDENITLSAGTQIQREFRWSIDQATYSEWIILANDSLLPSDNHGHEYLNEYIREYRKNNRRKVLLIELKSRIKNCGLTIPQLRKELVK